MYDAWFDQLPHDEDMTSREEGQVLKDFFDNKISAGEAARNLVIADGTKQPSNITNIWGLLLDAAQQIPESQPELVKLLAAIQDLDGVAFTLWNGKQERWIDLPDFVNEMADNYRALAARFGSSYAKSEFASNPQNYARLSAFGARLTARGVIDFTPWAIADLHSALEVDHSADPSVLDAYVVAVSEWVKHAGTPPAQSQHRLADPNGDVQRLRSLGTGDKTRFSKEQWAFWKGRFEVIGDLPGVSEMAREAAREAGKAMSC